MYGHCVFLMNVFMQLKYGCMKQVMINDAVKYFSGMNYWLCICNALIGQQWITGFENRMKIWCEITCWKYLFNQTKIKSYFSKVCFWKLISKCWLIHWRVWKRLFTKRADAVFQAFQSWKWATEQLEAQQLARQTPVS